MADDKTTETNTDPTGDLTAEEKATYLAIEASYKDDPSSIPAKFHNNDNPVRAFFDSYKQLERQLHNGGAEVAEEVEETDETVEETEATEETDDAGDMGSLEFKKPESEKVSDTLSLRDLGARAVRNGGKLSEDERNVLKTKYQMTDEDIDETFLPMANREAQAQVQAAVDFVGGKDNLKKINDYLVKNKTDAELAEINRLINDGNPQLILRGLMAEAGVTATKQNKQVKPETRTETQTVSGYGSQAELNKDLANPLFKDRWHPDHQNFVRKVNERILATKPGVLL